MVIYIFTRNKKTGHKKIIDKVDDVSKAREMCLAHNAIKSKKDWMEWTKDKAYAEN